MWVAQITAQRGYPVFGTGALYAQGLLFTYLDAFLFYGFGFSEWTARFPSLVLGVACIPLAYWVGSRILSDREGLLACALVALDPQSIGWGGRARSYSLLVFLALVAVYFLYLGVVRRDRPAYRRLALLFLVGAVFAHNEAILLYPAVLVVLLLWLGWRGLLRWPIAFENALAVAAMGVSFWLYRLMQPAGWSEVGEGRGEVALSLDVLRAWGRMRAFFFGPDQLPFVWALTVLVIAGLGYAVTQAWRKGPRQYLDPGGNDAGFLYLNVLLVVVIAEMLFFVSERRLGARYLFMLGPVFFMAASAVLIRCATFLVRLLPDRVGLRALSTRYPMLARYVPTAVFVALATVLALPASVAAARRQELPYDLAFEYVRDQMRSGDKVMAFATSPCVLYVGRCDYIAVQKDFHAYATQRGDYMVEAWAGAPILFTDEALERAIEEADRMWFVIDEMRFRTRYTDDFIQYVWDRMDLVAKEGGVFVFLSESPPPAPFNIERPVYYDLDGKAALLGYGLSGDHFEPGGEVQVVLQWEGLAHILQSYSVFVHLVDADGVMWAQHDGAPLRGLHPTTHWVAGEIVRDPHELTLAPDTPSGRYRLETGMYLPETLERLPVSDGGMRPLGDSIVLDYVRVGTGSAEPLIPEHPSAFKLGGEVALAGYDIEPPTGGPTATVRVTLYWRAEQRIGDDYTVFVHLVDESGHVWAQRDNQPEGGFYATSHWDVGESVKDEYDLAIGPDVPPGVYDIEVGMYLLATGERLPCIDQEGQVIGDAIVLGDVFVGE